MNDHHKYKILLIEDDPEDAFLLEELLSEKSGFLYSLTHVEKISEVDEKILGSEFDVILSDMNLPDSKGLDTVISVVEMFKTVPVIVLTGNNDEQVGVDSLNLGAQDYIIKGQPRVNQIIKSIKFAISRKKLLDELSHNQNMLQTIFEKTPINLLLINPDYQILKINKNALKTFNKESSMVVGNSIDNLFQHHTQQGVIKIFELLNNSISKRDEVHDVTVELPFSNLKSVNTGIFRLSITILNESDGPKYLIGLNEVTELEESKKKAQVANVHKNMFLANMSHEIRTPMNGVIGFAELLKQENLNPNTKNKYLDIIDSNSKQLLNLIDDIIDVAKIEANELKIIKERCDIYELLGDIVKTINRIKDKKKKIVLKLDTPRIVSFPYLYTDCNRLKQVYTNLINNALKFTETTITIGFTEKRNFIECYVTDDGIGISSDDQNKIFEQFKQVDIENDIKSGTGLGLAICKGIVEELGGKITVDSEPDKGATFRFTIPLEPVDKFEELKVSDHKKLNVKSFEGNKILVVDDELFILEYISAVLKPYNVEIIFAHEGKQAVSLYKLNPDISLVLMDIRMPIMNGFEAMKEILKINKDAHIIMQSAYAMNAEKEKCLNAGCVDYLVKPLAKVDLINALEKWLPYKC